MYAVGLLPRAETGSYASNLTCISLTASVTVLQSQAVSQEQREPSMTWTRGAKTGKETQHAVNRVRPPRRQSRA